MKTQKEPGHDTLKFFGGCALIAAMAVVILVSLAQQLDGEAERIAVSWAAKFASASQAAALWWIATWAFLALRRLWRKS